MCQIVQPPFINECSRQPRGLQNLRSLLRILDICLMYEIF